MSTNTTRPQNANECSFQAIAPPEALSPAEIDACAPAGADQTDADGRRVYAVARQDGVEHYGPGELEQRDACRILYLSPDGKHAAELQFSAAEGDYSEIPRSVVVSPTDERVDRPSEAVVERFGDVLEHHYGSDR